MKITILGSGSFISDLDHFGPAYLLEIDGKKILVDAGQGAMIQLLKLNVNVEDLDYIFITHFHADHIADLVPMIIHCRILSEIYGHEFKKPIQIFGPKGFRDRLKKISELMDHENTIEFKGINVMEFDERTEKMDRFSVTPFVVEHKGLTALSYRFDADNKTIVFSGDSTKCAGIEKAVENADVFFVDSSLPKDRENNIHLNTYQIGDICQKQNVKKVVLSHLLPLGYKNDLVSEVQERFDGEVQLAKDLMSMEV